MKKGVIALFWLFAVGFVYAQTRGDTIIYIPMPTGGTATEQSYFKENFEMETIAAGYTTTENPNEADYILRLEVQPNMVMYDDGTEEQAPPDEPQNLLELRLLQAADNSEVVMFNFPFTEVEEMYEYNLYLLYQAMANVPLTKLTSQLDPDHWRNKWLYIRGSIDYNISNYQADVKDSNNWQSSTAIGNDAGAQGDPLEPQNARSTTPMIGGTLGLEFQFLNWMAVEGDMKFVFGDPEESTLVPTVGVDLKFPLKPSKHFMLEPYVGVDVPMFTGTTVKNTSTFAALGGGFQFGVKGGNMGAFFVDTEFMYTLGNVSTRTSYRKADWQRWVLGFGIGYKLGFFNRNKDPDQSPTASY
ncbi:MAG: hypothetical protein LBD47_00985 [Treponema sp.]|jgi:hypothetical protein|nr:hypothetical protein [Treponema sp.]